MRKFRHSFLIMPLLIVVSCSQTTNYTSPKQGLLESAPGALISINFSDSNYSNLELYVKDTITSDGWSIKYLAKNDSTKYQDIYISCSRGSKMSIYKADNVLEYRRYFIPKFEISTKTNIYFTYGCATDCAAILIFDKDSTVKFTEYAHVVKYNTESDKILYVPDGHFGDEMKISEVAIADVRRHVIKTITFYGVCDAVYKPTCVEKTLFSKNDVSVTVRLRKTIENIEQAKQTKTVRF